MAMRVDEGFKLLFAHYPQDALAELGPEALAAWGPPQRAELLATEALPTLLQRRGRHMDFAVRFTLIATVRSPKSEVRSPKSEVRSPKSVCWSSGSRTRLVEDIGERTSPRWSPGPLDACARRA
jgi:hypothetical protein